MIRRIFHEFASGMSVRMIAASLNRDGIPSPVGATWGASTINGNLKRRSGFLYNEAYIGLLVFNRVQMVKDPETGKRVSRPNPPEQWQVVEAPHLRIVSDELWDSVQARKKLYGGTRLHERRRPKHMFSGLVRCGCCGASYTIKNREQLACAAHREKGTCTNNRTIRVSELERRVLDGIKRRLLAPETIAECLTEYHAERRRLMTKTRQERQQIDKRLAAIDRQIRNIIDGIATAGMKSRLIDIEAEKERISVDLAAMAESSNVVELHPASIEAYRRKVAELLNASQANDSERREAANVIRSLVTSIEVMPREGRGELELSVHGALAELLNLPHRKTGELPSTALMVAEDRYHQSPHLPEIRYRLRLFSRTLAA